jgi:Holliday junction resolvase
MGREARRKGADAEREVANIFRAAGFDVDRVPNSGGLKIKGDLTGLAGMHCEVKRQETLKLPAWLEQAREEAPEGAVPLVIFRRSREDWHAVIPLDALVELLPTEPDQ